MDKQWIMDDQNNGQMDTRLLDNQIMEQWAMDTRLRWLEQWIMV